MSLSFFSESPVRNVGIFYLSESPVRNVGIFYYLLLDRRAGGGVRIHCPVAMLPSRLTLFVRYLSGYSSSYGSVIVFAS